jgi:hypothetical protein
MNLSEWKDISEIAKNLIAVLAIFAGFWAWHKWRTERYDRATDVLFELQKEFNSDQLRRGRALIEDDDNYASFAPLLEDAIDRSLSERDRHSGAADLAAIDELLRFYVFLFGIRMARQVPDDSLSVCFRFWLAHYHSEGRKEFKHYIESYFPTLKNWLKTDRRFFRPEEFWPTQKP